MSSVRKLLSLILVVIGIIVVVFSTYYQEVYVAYTGLGIIFWGIIIALVVAETPLVGEELAIETGVECNLDESEQESELTVQPVINNIVPESTFETLDKEVENLRIETARLRNKLKEREMLNERSRSTWVRDVISQKTHLHSLTDPLQRVSQEIEMLASIIEQSQPASAAQISRDFEKLQTPATTDKASEETVQSELNPFPNFYPNKERVKKPKETDRIDPKFARYTEEITICPLRKHDKQDCIFCEVKNCGEHLGKGVKENPKGDVFAPKTMHYTKEVTVCPLRKHDKQDCFFCEIKNCSSYQGNNSIEKTRRVALAPEIVRYVEEVTVCPLRKHDKQDCFFCEAKNCQERIQEENK